MFFTKNHICHFLHDNFKALLVWYSGVIQRGAFSNRRFQRTQSSFSQPVTPQHSGFSGQLGRSDNLSMDLGGVDGIFGGSTDLPFSMPISEEVLFQVKPPPGMSHAAKAPQVSVGSVFGWIVRTSHECAMLVLDSAHTGTPQHLHTQYL